ncbi:MAG: hypothetical protein RL508_302 [Actinomycetota bacterium]|jgi:uncharacterized protein YciI
MAIFAVQYHYSAEPEQLAEIRPIHREWESNQFNQGALLAGGPLVNIPGALLLFKAEDVQSLAALLDTDPFDIAGCIGERVIEEWNPIFSPFNN